MRISMAFSSQPTMCILKIHDFELLFKYTFMLFTPVEGLKIKIFEFNMSLAKTL